MKALLAAALAAAALVTAVPAAAEEPDDSFLEVIDIIGIPVDDPASAVASARGACAALDGGTSVPVAVDRVASATGLTEDEGAYFVGVAIGAYCPQHEDLLS